MPVSLLRTIEQPDAGSLQDRLSALQAAEFLYEIESGNDQTFLFKHALTEEVTYASLLQDTRRNLHARLVDAIETVYQSRLDEHIEQLAHHALQAQRWDKAFRYNREAAKRAHERSSYPAAITRFENALAALENLPDDESYLLDKIDIRLEMRTALWPLGRHQEMEKRATEAGELAAAIGDIPRQANVHNFLCAHYWQAGEHSRAITHGENGIALARQAADFSVLVTTTQHLGVAHNACGNFKQQVALHRQVARQLTGPPASQRHGMAGYPAVVARGFLAWGLAELGEFEEALRWANEGTEIGRQINSAMSTVWVTNYLALTHLRRGDIGEAVSLMEPNFALCNRAEVRLLQTLTRGIFGYALCCAGDSGEGLPLMASAVEDSALRDHPEGSGYPFAWLAEGYLHAGRIAEARRMIDRSLVISRSQKERGHEAWALFTRAEIARVDGRPQNEVLSAYQAAHEAAAECGMRPLRSRCCYGIARTYLQNGQSEPGSDMLASARTAFQSMGMRYWAERSTASTAR